MNPWRRHSIPRKSGWTAVHRRTLADGAHIYRAIRRLPSGIWYVRVFIVDPAKPEDIRTARDFLVPHLHRTSL